MRTLRFFSVWLALDLCVKFVAMPAIGSVTDSTALPVYASGLVSLALAYGVLRRWPDLDTGALGNATVLVVCFGLAGHAAVALTVGRTPVREIGIGVVAVALAAVIARERWLDADPGASGAG
ncbi:hypothetical protein SAMN06269185_2261 [Natronoarchaeum philippinense]|uniref:Uncharacterized protein n=1 Tax=Natronoarchaeum philippinense TaxID=558529 RepID=A0A285NZ88_NATPI|nr:hypothetical protein [Natronoarchaeum philippinense]SNZ14804.1 hypothetical protein SAMN06269185_2261 [Natronoarchaeum philippinense]